MNGRIPSASVFVAALAFSMCAIAQSGAKPGAATVGGGETTKPFSFEVLSIRPHKQGTDLIGNEYLPNGYKGSMTLERAIMLAYIPQPWYMWSSSKLSHAPEWIDDWYDIDARVALEDAAAWQRARSDPGSLDSELLRSALRVMLAERCKLAFRITQVEAPYWDLVIDRHGARLKDTVPGAIKPIRGKTYKAGKGFYIQEGAEREFVGLSMKDLGIVLVGLKLDRPVEDKTGLAGRYDFTLPWYDYAHYPPSEISDPLERMPLKSIGLELKPGRGPGYVIDIEHIEQPEPN